VSKFQTASSLALLSLFLLLAASFNIYGQTPHKANNQSTAESAAVIKKLGTFTNMKSNGEHAWGYSVELWQEESRLFGFFLSIEGLIGDTPTGLLEDISFDSETGKLSFRARLTKGVTFNQKDELVPTRDVFRFEGILKDKILTGVLEYSNALTPSAKSGKTNVILHRSKKQSGSMLEAKSYDEWKKTADKILKFRGPKW
jgi:hypothetical protein